MNQMASATQDLLIEIGTEELPPKDLLRLSEAFQRLFGAQLDKQNLAHGPVEAFATPRRLALRVRDLAESQPDRELTRRGPAIAAAFDQNGNPSPALQGFARSCGVSVAELGRESNDKGTWICHRQTSQGARAQDLVPGLVEAALRDLPIPRRMRWSDLSAEFVRPVHTLMLLFGSQVIDAEIYGVRSDRLSRGHRVHHPLPLRIDHPGDYERVLEEQGRVIVSFDQRRQAIRRGVEAAAARLGLVAVVEADLLDEVAALVEWPVPLVGEFEASFLALPKEVLIATMTKNQKYFPLEDAQGRLAAKFIAIANLESLDPGQVRAGNERVIRPRFKDASFFWEQDIKNSLDALVARQADVVFQERLGTLLEKSERLAQVAGRLAQDLGFDVGLATRSGRLAKSALLTQMVREFPELQGSMGYHYALAGGEDPCVAQAMSEQYQPRFAADALPRSPCGQVLALADKLDNLVGIFAIGKRPTGEKDPFGLRRAAIGVLRILIETPLALDLRHIIGYAAESLAGKVKADGAGDEVFDYIMERLKGYYGEQGIGAHAVDAVLAKNPTVPSDIDQRIRAVREFLSLPECEALTAAHKRIKNILRKAPADEGLEVREALLGAGAERDLYAALADLDQRLAASPDHGATLALLAALRVPVDHFFDEVMVNDPDPALRNNRLGLLRHIEARLEQVADISRLQ